MPNGHTAKTLEDFGGHEYEESGTSDCKHECGCWMGPARSGGPVGLDPGGACPNNPADGMRRSGNLDYRDVVEARIRGLESRLYETKSWLNRVGPTKKKLAARVKELEAEVLEKGQLIVRMRLLLGGSA